MLAKGIQLLIGDGGGPETFSQVTGVVEFMPPGISWGVEDLTNHDSTSPATTQTNTVRTQSSVTLTIKPFDHANTNHALLLTLSQSGALRNFKIYHPGSSIGYMGPFEAFVKMSVPDTPQAGIYAARLEISPTGEVADAAAALVSVAVVDAHAGVYETGDTIVLRATFDEVVKMTAGSGPVYPRIPITLGSGTVYAIGAVPASPSNLLTFSYTFQGGDAALATEVAIGSPVQLNTGTINDMIGQAATLTFTAPDTSAFTVN